MEKTVANGYKGYGNVTRYSVFQSQRFVQESFNDPVVLRRRLEELKLTSNLPLYQAAKTLSEYLRFGFKMGKENGLVRVSFHFEDIRRELVHVLFSTLREREQSNNKIAAGDITTLTVAKGGPAVSRAMASMSIPLLREPFAWEAAYDILVNSIALADEGRRSELCERVIRVNGMFGGRSPTDIISDAKLEIDYQLETLLRGKTPHSRIVREQGAFL